MKLRKPRFGPVWILLALKPQNNFFFLKKRIGLHLSDSQSSDEKSENSQKEI